MAKKGLFRATSDGFLCNMLLLSGCTWASRDPHPQAMLLSGRSQSSGSSRTAPRLHSFLRMLVFSGLFALNPLIVLSWFSGPVGSPLFTDAPIAWEDADGVQV